MPDLSQHDIALGRAALAQGVISRPQLDAAVSVVRSGHAGDLSRALISTGGLTPAQLQGLQAQLGGNGNGRAATAALPRPTPGSGGSEEVTLHDMSARPGPPGTLAPPPTGTLAPPPGGDYSEMQTLHDGPPTGGGAFAPQGSSFGPGLGTPGSQSGFNQGGFGGPGGSSFGPPGGGGFGSPAGSSFGPPGGGGFGAPAGSSFGAPGGGGFGSGSALGGGFGSGSAPGFGTPPPPSSFGGGGFGAPPAGGGFGGVGGSTFGSSPGGGQAVAASAFGMSPSMPSSPVQDGEDEQIGVWRIERELARGGMGVIYVGSHESTGEKAAIKVMLQTDGTVAPRKVKRFLREIDSNRKLSHEGIVRILDSGEFRGYPFFAMEYVEGKPLDRMLKDDLDLEIGMEIIEAVARAVHYAHDQDIIHRDLKPANVIVQEDMKPKLTDFGLAKNKDHESVLTKTGAVLGTPYYLSPEQAQGRSKSIDRRADVYSLGVIMYELATGRLPFVGQTTVELYNRIIHDDPVPPTKIKPQLTKALETVCLKAMAKDLDERYPTAEAFADDIAALLQGGTIKAKPDGPVKRLIKRLKKKSSIGLVVGGTVVLLALVIGGLAVHHKRSVDARHQALVEQEYGALESFLEEHLQEMRDEVESGQTVLRQSRLPEALEDAKEALTALEAIDERFAKLEYEENKEPIGKLIDEHAEERAKVHASALVLRARATMVRDERGTLDKATKDLELVLAEKDGIRPGDPQALVAQGDLFALTGALTDALDKYAEALTRSPNSVRALLGKARAQVLKEDFEEAISDVTKALKILEGREPAPAAEEDEEAEEEGPPVELEVISDEEKGELAGLLLIERTRARLELGDLDKALTDAKLAAEKLGGQWRAKAIEGEVLAYQGRAFAARDAYDAGIAKATEHGGPYEARAEGLLVLGYAQAAYDDAATAVSLDARSLTALVLRAEAAASLLRFEEAETDAEAVQLRAQPRHWRVAARAERVLAHLDAIRNAIPDAHDHAKKARTLDEYASANKLIQSRLELDPYFEGQYLDSAERLLKQVLRQRPRSLEAKRGLGLVLLQKYVSQPARAQRKLEDALDIDPHDPQTLAAFAEVFKAKAKKEPGRSKNFLEHATRNWQKALRYERDVRRPEGLAFATGLRHQLASEKLTIRRQAEEWEKAQIAYRQALWLDPKHAHALTGLAAISHMQGSFKRTKEAIDKAMAANPNAIHSSVLKAYHHATQDGVAKGATKAESALKKAIELRGETTELKMCSIFLTGLKKSEDLTGKLNEIRESYIELRKQDPYNVAIFKKEAELLARLADENLDAESKEKIRDRKEAVMKEIRDLQDARSQRAEASQKLQKECDALLAKGKALKALRPADRAVHLAPWDPAAWWLLARSRRDSSELWGALAAGIRAAYLDGSYVGPLFELLREAGTSPSTQSKEEIAEYLMLDNGVPPFPKDLEHLLLSAPLVARAMVMDVEQAEAKELFNDLERALENDPTRLLSHAMLGALAFGVRRDEYAIQHLLFVATVRQDLGQAYYLAAVAAGRSRSKDPKLDVLAIESLNSATRAGFDWRKLGEKEKGLKRLRESDLWKRLEAPKASKK